MSSPPRRLTHAARARLNELVASGVPMTDAMSQVAKAPDAYEEAPEHVATGPAPLPPWSGDDTDWDPVRDKLARLRALDRGRTGFGASRHGYELAPVLAERGLAAVERKLGVALPPGLRAFYATMGNGGAGPGFGMFAAAKLRKHKPATPYPGVAALRRPGSDRIPPSRLVGVLAVADHGCGIYSAIVATGDVGRVISYDEDGISELDQTLIAHYTEWLDRELARFELVARLVDEGATPDEMEAAMAALLPAKQRALAKSEVALRLRGLQP